jgi:hypothetical protein
MHARVAFALAGGQQEIVAGRRDVVCFIKMLHAPSPDRVKVKRGTQPPVPFH